MHLSTYNWILKPPEDLCQAILVPWKLIKCLEYNNIFKQLPVRVRRPCALPASPGWGPGRSTGRTGSPRFWSAGWRLLSTVVVVVVTFLTADSWPKASHIIKLIKLNKVAFHVCTTQLGSGPIIFRSAVADKRAAGEPQRGTFKCYGMPNLSWLATEQLLTPAWREAFEFNLSVHTC